MNFLSKTLSIILSLTLLLVIFELVRRRKLKEKYAILWIFTGLGILILAVFNNLLSGMAHLFGIKLPINVVYFFGIFFIIIINLHFSMVISALYEQNKKIAQKLALLEIKIKNIKKNDKE